MPSAAIAGKPQRKVARKKCRTTGAYVMGDTLEIHAMRRTAFIKAAVTAAVFCTGCGKVGGKLLSMGSSVSISDGQVTVTIDGKPPVAGSGKLAKEDRKVAGYRAISASTGIRVNATIGDKDSISVEADDNLLALIGTNVEDGVLVVKATGSLKTKNPIKVTVSAKQIERLAAASSASIIAAELAEKSLAIDVSSSGTAQVVGRADSLRVAASSSGTFDGTKLPCATCTVDCSSSARTSLQVSKGLSVGVHSSGQVIASGEADLVKIDASSSGRFDGKGLKAKSVQAACSSSSLADVHATEALTGSANSSGTVRYHHVKPINLNVETSSGGRCIKG